jgi:hypothetical protein
MPGNPRQRVLTTRNVKPVEVGMNGVHKNDLKLGNPETASAIAADAMTGSKAGIASRAQKLIGVSAKRAIRYVPFVGADGLQQPSMLGR